MKIVFLTGCFDIITRAHIDLFEYAKTQFDNAHVIVATDSDEKIKLEKGSDRPYNNLYDRVKVLNSIKYIDAVFSFESEEKLNDLCKLFVPDIRICGSDWKDKKIIGQEHCKEIIYFDRITGYSTTNVLKGIKP